MALLKVEGFRRVAKGRGGGFGKLCLESRDPCLQRRLFSCVWFLYSISIGGKGRFVRVDVQKELRKWKERWKEGKKEAISSPNLKTLRLALKICMTFATSSSIPRRIGCRISIRYVSPIP